MIENLDKILVTSVIRSDSKVKGVLFRVVNSSPLIDTSRRMVDQIEVHYTHDGKLEPEDWIQILKSRNTE